MKHLNISLAFVILLLLQHSPLVAQSFTEQTDIALPGFRWGSIAWGDYDNDGYPDLLMAGSGGRGVFRNIGGNSFTSVEDFIIPNSYASFTDVDWGDFDNDGDLDVLIIGKQFCRIYKNNGDHTFSEQTDIPLTPAENAAIAWGDYDSDGDLDILLSGENASEGLVAKIYRNCGADGFEEQSGIRFTGVFSGSVDWGDYDRDGDLDIVLTGTSGSNGHFLGVSKIYKNNGDNSFSEETSIDLPEIRDGTAIWGDYDNDGYLDLLISGNLGAEGCITRIYKNNGGSGFIEQSGMSLAGLTYGSADWGDYDNDGDLDLLLTGVLVDPEWAYVTKVYKNNGDNSFTEQSSLDLPGVRDGCARWGDYDKDGDLDIIVSGDDSETRITKIFKNDCITTNSLPETPGNIQQLVHGNSVTFSWNSASDVETPQAALSYNLQVGTTVNGPEIKSPMADISSGSRNLVRSGEIQGTTWTMQHLSAGTYYWRVQAVDQTFQGSAFSSSRSFTISFTNTIAPVADQSLLPGSNGVMLTVSETEAASSRQWKYSKHPGGPYDYPIPGASGKSYTPNFSDFGTHYVVCVSEKGGAYVCSNEVQVDIPFFSEQGGASLEGISHGSVHWGDYDNDRDLDILLTGRSGDGTPVSRIYRNNGSTFSDQTSIVLPAIAYGNAIWGDDDNDGDLDILLTGRTEDDLPVSRIFRNNGNNTFSEQTDIALTGTSYNTIAWHDFDHDGDLDIFMSGNTSSEDQVCVIYRNDRNKQYTELQPGIMPFTFGEVDLGDYDNDTYCDLLVSGMDYSGNYITKVYRNNRDQTFSEQYDIDLRNIKEGAVAWGDYDNDGDLDILISGDEFVVEGQLTLVYRNNGDNSFVEQTVLDLTGVNNCSVSWCDYDNDGDLDIYIAGNSYLLGYISVFYRNNGDNSFSEDSDISLPGFASGSVAWGDFDNDQDMDLITTGYHPDYGRTSSLFRNNTLHPNHAPSTPDQLSSSVFAGGATLTWDKSSDQETAQDGLSYNICVSTTKDGTDVVSPMSDSTSGFRRIPEMGNAYNNQSYTIEGLATGKYYWSVQAVDQNFAGSEFSPVDSFTVLPKFTQMDVGLPDFSCQTLAPGDYDADGDMDILALGSSGFRNYFSRIYRNDENTSFADLEAGLINIGEGDAAWCDFDHDGDLDIGISGTIDGYIDGANTRIVKNNGNDSFTEQTNFELIGICRSSLDWGDLDNDGLQDLFIAGLATERLAMIYGNNGDNTFTGLTSIGIEGVEYSSVDLGDYDNDMDLDILLSGKAYIDEHIRITRVYKNNGDNSFTDINADLIGVAFGSVKWGDYDNDGDLDILLTGSEFSDDKIARIYRNDGADTFTDINALIRGATQSSAQWGDYDNDGDLDILFSGRSASAISRINRNDGEGAFTELDFGVLKNALGSISWMDFDNDRDLDILFSGYSYDDYNHLTTIIRNNGNWSNSRPLAPGKLQAESQGFGVVFSWDPATDDQTPSQALSYNIRVGTGPGSYDIIAPQSDIVNGDLLLPQMGNCMLNTGWRLDSLPVGSYYWSVQAVDNTYLGGNWSPEQSFTLTAVNADFKAEAVCEGLATTFTDLSISSAGPVTAWQWDFGDGNSSSDQDPQHIFAAAGTHQVQLVATSGAFSDTIALDVVVKPKPTAGFSADVVCQGSATDFTNLSALNGCTIAGWLWVFGDGASSTARDPFSHGYLNAGEYTVSLSAAADNGCSDVATSTVPVGAYPVAGITVNGKTEFCPGDSVILSNEYNGGFLYQWKIDGNNLTGADSSRYVAKTTGEYSLEVTNPLGSCTDVSDTMLVTVNDPPLVPVILTGNYEEGACPGEEPVILSVETVEDLTTYQWKRNGSPINGATESTYSAYLDEGEYSVMAIGSSCSSESELLTISYGEMPDKPEIIVEGPVVWYLACSNDSASAYRWFRNGELITGAEDYIHVAGSQTGRYEVAVSMGSSCFAMSDAVQIPLGTGMNQDIWENLNIYPNPTPGLFTLEMDNAVMGELIIDIFGESGTQIINIKFLKETTHFKTEIDLSAQPAGLYLIGLLLEEYSTNRKLIVE